MCAVFHVILLCLASSTSPRRRNLLVALMQYTVTHFRSSSWFLSSLIDGKNSAWKLLNRRSNPIYSYKSLNIQLNHLNICGFPVYVARPDFFCKKLFLYEKIIPLLAFSFKFYMTSLQFAVKCLQISATWTDPLKRSSKHVPHFSFVRLFCLVFIHGNIKKYRI